MNNDPFTDILSGLVGACITCLFEYIHHKREYNNVKLHRAMKIVLKIQYIASDFKNVYRSVTITNNKRAKVSSDMIQLNAISLAILSNKVNKHLIWKLDKQNLNWIADYLHVTYNIYMKYPQITNNYEKAYKRIFKFHKKDDKYEIKIN